MSAETSKDTKCGCTELCPCDNKKEKLGECTCIGTCKCKKCLGIRPTESAGQPPGCPCVECLCSPCIRRACDVPVQHPTTCKCYICKCKPQCQDPAREGKQNFHPKDCGCRECHCIYGNQEFDIDDKRMRVTCAGQYEDIMGRQATTEHNADCECVDCLFKNCGSKDPVGTGTGTCPCSQSSKCIEKLLERFQSCKCDDLQGQSQKGKTIEPLKTIDEIPSTGAVTEVITEIDATETAPQEEGPHPDDCTCEVCVCKKCRDPKQAALNLVCDCDSCKCKKCKDESKRKAELPTPADELKRSAELPTTADESKCSDELPTTADESGRNAELPTTADESKCSDELPTTADESGRNAELPTTHHDECECPKCDCEICNCESCPDKNVKNKTVSKENKKHSPTCDYDVCKCNRCADESKRKAELQTTHHDGCVCPKCVCQQCKRRKSGDSPCDCDSCQCQSCLDKKANNKTVSKENEKQSDTLDYSEKDEKASDSTTRVDVKENEKQSASATGDDSEKKEEPKEKPSTTDYSKKSEKHSATCDCEVCKCERCAYVDRTNKVQNKLTGTSTTHPPGYDCVECACGVKSKGISSKRHPPGCDCLECECAECGVESKGTSSKRHPPGCDCLECECGVESKGTSSKRHPPGCDCLECECAECGVENKGTSSKRHPPGCDCLECECGVESKGISSKRHPPGCDCLECECGVESKGTSSTRHPPGCDCLECACTECGVKSKGISSRRRSDMYDSSTDTKNKAQKTNRGSSANHGANCNCLECVCNKCVFKDKMSNKKNLEARNFNKCKCDTSSKQSRDRGKSSKPINMERETAERRNEVKEIRDVLNQIRCACAEAEIAKTSLQPIVKRDICEPECECAQDKSVDVSSLEIMDIRRITQDSILIKWTYLCNHLVTGFHILINGKLVSKVACGNRTNAVIHGLNLNTTINIEVYAVTKLGRCQPPALAIYKINEK